MHNATTLQGAFTGTKAANHVSRCKQRLPNAPGGAPETPCLGEILKIF